MTLDLTYVIFQPVMAENLAPFLKCVDKNSVYQHLIYESPVQDLLWEIGLIDPLVYPPKDLARFTFHPAHLIEATVNYKIDHPGAQGTIEMIKTAVKVGLDIFSLRPNRRDAIEEYQKIVVESGNGLLFSRFYSRRELDVNWSNVYENDQGLEPVSRLMRHTNSRDVLIVALGGAAYTPALDIFTRYCGKTGSSQSLLYPVRFSIYAYSDPQPQLTPEEIQFLKEAAVDRYFVLFDLFTGWGHTTVRAAKYMQEEIAPKDWGVFIKVPDETEYYSKARLKELYRKDPDKLFEKLKEEKRKYLTLTEHLRPKMMI
jgi:hypothetical protein